jgi:hypothetical protein
MVQESGMIVGQQIYRRDLKLKTKNNLMTKITKQFAAAFAVAGTLAVAGSAMAQGVTGPQYLSNMDPANVQFFNLWQTPPATVTQTSTGL